MLCKSHQSLRTVSVETIPRSSWPPQISISTTSAANRFSRNYFDPFVDRRESVFHFQLGLRNTQITAKRFRSNFANKPYTLPLCRHFLEYTRHTWHLAVRGEKAQSWRATECAISFPEPAFPLSESAGWHSLKCEQVFGRASFILFFVCWFVFWYTIKASK